MSAPPPLFDPNLRALRRARARALGMADFLHVEAASQVAERLEEINRTFPDRILVGPWPAPWQAERVVRDAVPDDDLLDLAPGTFDLVVHGLCLHGANDPVGQLVQCRRALRPDGLCLAVAFGGQTLHELRSALAEAETRVRGGLSPRIHPMGEIRDMGALLQRAGFALPVADSFALSVQYDSPFHLMRDLRAMGETNILSQQARTGLRRDVLTEAMEIYAGNFAGPDGRVTATFELVFLTGWAPAADQPQPLKPGSAQTRLASALGVPERPAGEKAGK